jgi:hypothetical protein
MYNQYMHHMPLMERAATSRRKTRRSYEVPPEWECAVHHVTLARGRWDLSMANLDLFRDKMEEVREHDASLNAMRVYLEAGFAAANSLRRDVTASPAVPAMATNPPRSADADTMDAAEASSSPVGDCA